MQLTKITTYRYPLSSHLLVERKQVQVQCFGGYWYCIIIVWLHLVDIISS